MAARKTVPGTEWACGYDDGHDDATLGNPRRPGLLQDEGAEYVRGYRAGYTDATLKGEQR